MTVRPVVLALCLLAAACGQKSGADGDSTAAAEILPGSISDSMIDLDTSTASPPMAPVRADPVKKSASAARKPENEDEPAVAPAPAEAPAESPDAE